MVVKEQQADLFWSWVAILAFLFSLAVLTPDGENQPSETPPPPRAATPLAVALERSKLDRPAPAPFTGRHVPTVRMTLRREPSPQPTMQLLAPATSASGQTTLAVAKAPRQATPPDAELSLPSLREPGPRANEGEAFWQTPHELLARLDALSVDPRAERWAGWVRGRIECLTTAGACADEAAAFDALRRAADEVEPLAAAARDERLTGEWRRAEWALRRRLQVWLATRDVRQASIDRAPGVLDERQLTECLSSIDRALASADSAAGWREYLLLDDLRSSTVERGGSDAQREIAARVLERLDAAKLTPAQRLFLASGPAVELGQTLRAATAPPIAPVALLSEIERYESQRQSSLARQVALRVRRLAESPAPEDQNLGSELDAYYRNCNLRVAIAADLLTLLLPPQPDVDEPVRTTILGHPVTGWGTTQTNVAVRLVPDPQRLRLQLETRGEIASTTTARSGPVSLDSDNFGRFVAAKPLVIDVDGVSAGATRIEAHNQSHLNRIRTRYDNVPLVGALVREYARGEHERSQDAARREAERQIRDRAGGKVDAAVERQLGEANEALQAKVLGVLRGLSLEPQWMLAETTETRLTARLRLANDRQLGAHTPRPRAPSDSLASLQVHESAINNLLSGLELSGRTFTTVELCRHIGERLNLADVAPPEGVRRDLSFSFAAEDAVQAKCDEGRIEIALRCAELKMEGKRWSNLLVRAYYKPEANDPNVELVRDGSIQLSGDRLSPRGQIVLRGLFSRVFDRDARFAPLARLFAEPRLAGLGITQFVIQDGWMGVAIGPRRMGDEPIVAER